MGTVLLINGSPRKNGNTAAMLREIETIVGERGHSVDRADIAGKPISGCNSCGKCRENMDGRCIINDALSDPIAKALKADALVIGSPVYFADATPEVKAFIDRCGRVARVNGFALEKKIGAAAVAVRRAGSIHTMDTIHHMFLINKMFVAGSSYWSLAVARDIGDYEGDTEGVATMRDLGKNIAWFLENTA